MFEGNARKMGWCPDNKGGGSAARRSPYPHHTKATSFEGGAMRLDLQPAQPGAALAARGRVPGGLFVTHWACMRRDAEPRSGALQTRTGRGSRGGRGAHRHDAQAARADCSH